MFYLPKASQNIEDFSIFYPKFKKVNRKVQGIPQSQTAANPWHQEEEKKDKNIHAQNKQMYKKHKDQLPLPQVRWSEC